MIRNGDAMQRPAGTQPTRTPPRVTIGQAFTMAQVELLAEMIEIAFARWAEEYQGVLNPLALLPAPTRDRIMNRIMIRFSLMYLAGSNRACFIDSTAPPPLDVVEFWANQLQEALVAELGRAVTDGDLELPTVALQR